MGACQKIEKYSSTDSNKINALPNNINRVQWCSQKLLTGNKKFEYLLKITKSTSTQLIVYHGYSL